MGHRCGETSEDELTVILSEAKHLSKLERHTPPGFELTVLG
jgi:hypothetical protein